MTYLNATYASLCLMLYVNSDRRFWIASDLNTRAVFGRFNAEWWAS